MEIREFGVEIWMNRHENDCELNLAETCVESLTVAELLAMAGKTDTILAELLPLKLTYGAIAGSLRLRGLIASLYAAQGPDDVVVTHGRSAPMPSSTARSSSRGTASSRCCRPTSSMPRSRTASGRRCERCGCASGTASSPTSTRSAASRCRAPSSSRSTTPTTRPAR